MSSSEEKLEALASFTSNLLASASAAANENENPDETKVDDKPIPEPVTDMETGDNDQPNVAAETSHDDDDDTRNQLEEHLDLGEEVIEAHDEPETAPQSPDPFESEPTKSANQEVEPNHETQAPATSEYSRPVTPISRSSRPASPGSPRDIEIEYKDGDDKVIFL